MLVEASLFIGLVMATLLAALLVSNKYKVPLLKSLKASGAWNGIVTAILGVFTVGLLVGGAYALADSPKQPIRYAEYTTVFIGIDRDFRQEATFCYRGDINDRLTSNLGVRQHLVGYQGIDIVLQYTHHSCAFNADKPTYDAAGLILEWTFSR